LILVAGLIALISFCNVPNAHAGVGPGIGSLMGLRGHAQPTPDAPCVVVGAYGEVCGDATPSGVINQSESWLDNVLKHDPASVTELHFTRKSTLIQMWEGSRLYNIVIADSNADIDRTVRLAVNNGVRFSRINESPGWDMGSPEADAWFFGILGVLWGTAVGALLYKFRTQVKYVFSNIGYYIAVAKYSVVSFFGSIGRRWKHWRANLPRSNYYSGSGAAPSFTTSGVRKSEVAPGESGANSASKALVATKAKKPVKPTIKDEDLTPKTLKGGATVYLPGSLKCPRLSDIIGQRVAIEKIQEMINSLKHPAYARLEASMPKGVLLIGPPGTGKTLTATAVCEAFGVPFISVAGSGFVEMFVGVGAGRVRELFTEARRLKEIYGACIIFIDEFDAMAGKRNDHGGNDERETTLNQFLVEMNGFGSREGIIVWAATNRKDMLDPAAIRPGRFDLEIEFFLPTLEERIQMLSHYLPERLRAPFLNLHAVAKAIPGASGAVIRNIVNKGKLWQAKQDPFHEDPKVSQEALDEGAVATVVGEKSSMIVKPKHRRVTAVHEGGHALLTLKLAKKAPLRFSILPRGQTLGHIQNAQNEDGTRTREELIIEMAIAFGGAIATAIECNGQLDTGMSQDNLQASQIAYRMVTEYGMSELGWISIKAAPHPSLISQKRLADIDDQVAILMKEARALAHTTIEENIEDLRLMVKEVEEHETLLEDDFKRLFMGGIVDE
jgi:cell division protease FtsH